MNQKLFLLFYKDSEFLVLESEDQLRIPNGKTTNINSYSCCLAGGRILVEEFGFYFAFRDIESPENIKKEELDDYKNEITYW